jgi:hypothetical protein
MLISFVFMTKGNDYAGFDRVEDREATAGGGEWGSRFCRWRERRMLRAFARTLRSAKLGGPFVLEAGEARMV